MPLTDTKIRAAKPKASKYKLSDGQGLQLHVLPSGTMTWKRAYRFDGRQRDVTLGTYPTMGLADARDANRETSRLLEAGRDPSAEKRAKAAAGKASRANTFAAVAEMLVTAKTQQDREDMWRGRTLQKNEWLLRLAKEGLGPRPISEITAPEILAVARKLEARGHAKTAVRLIGIIGMVFSHAIGVMGVPITNPTPSLRRMIKAPPTTHRAAILERNAFGGLLRAIDGYSGQPETRLALLLLAHTFVRPGELRLARWEEFDWKAAEWTIPAQRMKMNLMHIVPLSKQALAMLGELRDLTGANKSGLLFPGQPIAARPMSDATLGAALRRLGFAKDEASPHGFRSTARSMLEEEELFSQEALEAALSHRKKDETEKAYARATHLRARVALMQHWSDMCDAMMRGGEVVALRRA